MLVVCICSQQANKISLKALLSNAFFYLAIALPPKAPQDTTKHHKASPSCPQVSFSHDTWVSLPLRLSCL